MRFEGNLQSWNDERGFGFIAADQGGDPVFVHIKAFGRGAPRPQLQQRLSFEIEPGPEGKQRTRNVQLIRTNGGTSSTASNPAEAPCSAALLRPLLPEAARAGERPACSPCLHWCCWVWRWVFCGGRHLGCRGGMQA